MMRAHSNAELARECLRLEGFECPSAPTIPTHDLATLWPRLLREEVGELESAFEANDIVAVADALADILYVAYQAAANCGLPVDDVFAEVHRSNLTKVGPDGNVSYRPDGKVMKPAHFSPPDIASVLARRVD